MKSSERLAIAFDVGTTTIAASLLDPGKGERLAAAGSLNPQREFGADVVSRLDAACDSPEKLKRLARLINKELERLATELLAAAGASIRDVAVIAIAGNPAMEHLVLELPVRSLAFPPYRPLFTAGKMVSTATLGWHKDIDLLLFPLPGGFVGGDLVAFLYGVGAGPRSSGIGARLYLDLGTNGEMALTTGTGIFATSAAAGPAFEGGNLEYGMAALPGAISGVTFSADSVKIAAIPGASPAGVCGSGVIDAVAGLLRTGVVDATGRLRSPDEIPSNLANRLAERNGEAAFVLYRDARGEICLTQQDIRQVQLAKAAIRAGMEVLFERAGIRSEDLEGVVLTGSFGSRLSPGELKNVGIFPEKMVEICSFVRDGALAGVEKALRTPRGFEAVDRLASSLRVIPLSGTPAFEKHFLEYMNFPKHEI
ncbi:MAG TPA: ASKHA domain-containing protein [Geobacteraceae bacterium]|nr:ASKHA domain-containing protein [Geobacteraceae bacterium]